MRQKWLKLNVCFIKAFVIAASLLSIQGCTSTTAKGEVGVSRRQLLIAPADKIDQMSMDGYEQLKNEAQQKGLLNKNPQALKRIQTIVNRLVAQVGVFREDAKEWKWEVHIIQSDEINAFCMPGGKMIVYSGILDRLNLSDDEAAAVLGHEIAHALREHGRERISEEMIKQGGLQLLIKTGKLDPTYANAANQVSVLLLTLPNGRKQETEADKIGLELMARAGYSPEAAVSLWKKMGSNGKSKPPEILSTHPSDERRISSIEQLIPKVMPLYHPKEKKTEAQ